MLIPQTKTINMYKEVIPFIGENMPALRKLNPELEFALKDFVSHTIQLPTLIKATRVDVSEYTRQKKQARIALTTEILFVAGTMRSMAIVKEDRVLNLLNKYTLSELKSAKQAIFYTICLQILERAKGLSDEFSHYGQTPEYIKEVNELFKKYADLRGAPRAMQGQKMAAQQTLDVKIAEMDKILKKIDMMMKEIKPEEPTLHKEYLKRRRRNDGKEREVYLFEV